tara:strand:+ start:8694 stop:9071 length:378 start_codon:yes stop_codon:yes gene_type:complete
MIYFKINLIHQNYKMKVYYNGSCNICNAEISHYKKIKKNINYIDISKSMDKDISHLSKKNLFRRMHVYDQGKLFIGSESFLVLWEKMPKLRYLAMFLKLPIFRQLWNIIYELAAIILYLKNKSKL